MATDNSGEGLFTVPAQQKMWESTRSKAQNKKLQEQQANSLYGEKFRTAKRTLADTWAGTKPKIKTTKAKGPSTIPQRDLAPEPAGPQYSTFEEMLDAILSKYGAGSGGGVDRSPYDAAGAKIAAMYKQLEGSYGADAETLKKLFADATAAYAANAAQATGAINQAYSSTQAERARQLQALGIQESAAVYGDTAARDQASAVSNIARLLEATQGRNTGYQNAALTLNEQMKGVARAQGAAQQAAVQQAYANAAAKAASSGGMDLGDAISIARNQMSEQDKMIKGLTPAQTYGYDDTQQLWDTAASLYPDDTSKQSAWVSSMIRTR